MSVADSDYLQSSRELTESKRKAEFPIGKQRAALREIQPIHSLISVSNTLETIAENPVVTTGVSGFVTTYEKGLELCYCDVRSAATLQPVNMRRAFMASQNLPVRRQFQFQPGFNDKVNDCLRMNRDPCLLSVGYRENDLVRSLFFRQVTQNRDWIAVPSLVRKIDDLFYVRVEFNDVLMFHPTAWGFPEADLNPVVVGVPGHERDPMHGWLSQDSRNTDSEMNEVTFAFRYIVHRIAPSIIEKIISGSLPDWLQGISDISADTGKIDEFIRAKSDQANWEVKKLLRAGLIDEEDVYVKVSDLHNTRLLEPDCLDSSTRLAFSVKGLNGLRSCLAAYSRQHATPISPSQVTVMAFQLGIENFFHFYWFALFALRYPLPKEWTSLVSSDNVRVYISLETGRSSHLHPLLNQLKDLLSDFEQSEILFDVRGSFTPPCDECGKPDAVLTCSQCTDMMCVGCFLRVHERRRASHWAIPVAGCRYLSEEEVHALEGCIPATNVGFCNRRRFLARFNQSDKTGPCQCCWLHFDSDFAFDSVYSGQCEARRNPRGGFYYNFETHAISVSSEEFAGRAKLEQGCALLIQRWVRGYLSRKHQERKVAASIVVQKNVRMLIARKRFGKSRKDNAFNVWYKIFKLRMQRDRFLRGVVLVQAKWRAIYGRGKFERIKTACIKIQAVWRGFLARRRDSEKKDAALKIQAVWRGWFYGQALISTMNRAACVIQARARGIAARHRMQVYKESSIRIQSVIRGYLARSGVETARKASTLIQTWWRRYVAIMSVKRELVGEIESSAKRYEEMIREKSMGFAAVEIQRIFKGHFQRKKFQKFLHLRNSSSRFVSSIVAFFVLALTQLHAPFHCWIRYLPIELRDKLVSLKGVVQRAIVNSGEQVAEALLREIVSDALKTCGEVDEISCVYWISHNLCHLASKPHTCFKLKTLGELYSKKKESILDSLLKIENENYFVSALSSEPSAQAAVLTSSLLITYREFLNQPRLRLESTLSFQGVDSSSAAQLLDIVGSEFGLSHDFPTNNWAASIGRSCCGNIEKNLREFINLLPPDIESHERDDERKRFHFITKDQVWTFLKTLGKLVRGNSNVEKWQRHCKEISALLSSARSETSQEHLAYIVSVALVHAIFRGLIMREVSRRAATCIQVAFRYYKTRTVIKRIKGPVLTIQRYWRGLRAALDMYRQDRAAGLIQENFRIILGRRRNEKLVTSVGKIQRVWRGAIQRDWLEKLHASAIKIQALFRGQLVRLVIGTNEGRCVRKAFIERMHLFSSEHPGRKAAVNLEFREAQEDLKVKALIAKRSRARVAQRKIEQYRRAMDALTKNTAIVGKCTRGSVFEPLSFSNRLQRTARIVDKRSEGSSLVPAAEKINRNLESWLKLID